jgi:hypothetical protein
MTRLNSDSHVMNNRDNPIPDNFLSGIFLGIIRDNVRDNIRDILKNNSL